ncbi:hypothetical protein ACQEU3_16470 [Spirillospora sp. CA-253888]
MNRSTRSLLRAAAALAPAAVLLAAAAVPAGAAQREIDRTVDEVLQPVTSMPVTSMPAAPGLAPISLPAKSLKSSTTLKRAAAHRVRTPAACPAAARCPHHDHQEAAPGGLTETQVGEVVRSLDVAGLVKSGEAGQVTKSLGARTSGRRPAGGHLPKVPGSGVLNGVTRSGTVAPVLDTVSTESVLPAGSNRRTARRATGPVSPLPLGTEQVQGVLNGRSGDPVQDLLGGVTGQGGRPNAMVSGRLGGIAGGLTDTSGLVPPVPSMPLAS